MNKPKIVLIGGGGHCKVVISILKKLNKFEIYGISDTKQNIGKTLLGVKINSLDSNLPKLLNLGVEFAFLTIGNVDVSNKRKELFTKIKKIDFKVPVIISKDATVDETVKIGDGTVIMPGVIINVDTIIGKNCIINTGTTIDHDCIIGDHVHIAPGVNLSGQVKIGDGTMLGIGSKVIQNITVGKSSLIGAGSIVVKNIPNNVKVSGVPAKIVSKI